jgi:SAM-dependent methyltransferase
VRNPWTEYDEIYDMNYFSGCGADRSVNYVYEMQHVDRTVRRYEWRGIARNVNRLLPLDPESRWLDFGCGSGGLVRYVLEQKICRMFGYDEGAAVNLARELGLPILDASSLGAQAGMFDVVTAIEVLEHLTDPLGELRRIRRLLKPGGLFYYTTGNARPWRNHFFQWSYVLPEVHVSFFEAGTMEKALTLAGFRPQARGYLPGDTDIIRFKLLKAFRRSDVGAGERVLPWGMIGRLVNALLKITDMPIAWADDALMRQKEI